MRPAGHWLARCPLDQSGPLPTICLRTSWPEATLEATTTPGDESLASVTFEDHIGFLLRRAHQRHAAIFTAAMDVAAIPGFVWRPMVHGLVRRSRDPMDRRTAVPVPTEAGVALIRSVVASAGRAHEAPVEQTQLLGLLRKMG